MTVVANDVDTLEKRSTKNSSSLDSLKTNAQIQEAVKNAVNQAVDKSKKNEEKVIDSLEVIVEALQEEIQQVTKDVKNVAKQVKAKENDNQQDLVKNEDLQELKEKINQQNIRIAEHIASKNKELQ